jgi:molybdopterin-guanine dinucleotide biosynthesis protein A
MDPSGAAPDDTTPDDTTPDGTGRPRVAGIVLAGGASTRFGSDKTKAVLRGRTLLELTLEPLEVLRTEGVLDDLVVVGPWAPRGVAQSIEPEPGRGPLAGLAHGLDATAADVALVVAADQPWLEPALLRLLIELSLVEVPQGGRRPGAVVPVTDDGPQPLVACYSADCSTVAASLLDTGRRSLMALLEALLDQVDVRWVPPVQWSPLDPEGRSFRDVDTPADLDADDASPPERQQPER